MEGSDALTFVTDRRSGKVAEAAANPAAEVAWYLPITREQYRISGRLDVIKEDRRDAELAAARRRAWVNMSDAGERAGGGWMPWSVS
jgi:pyridoxamine 5'-phosphate oxidase